jgi:hypothetical protein
VILENPLEAEIAFPILECFHIAGFAVAIGTIALADFRMLNTGILTLISLLTAIFSGMLMYSTDPDKYYLNWSFLIKVACLIVAIVFHYTVHRKIVYSDAITGGSKAVACVSLALWASVVFGGIFIAFVLPGLD